MSLINDALKKAQRERAAQENRVAPAPRIGADLPLDTGHQAKGLPGSQLLEGSTRLVLAGCSLAAIVLIVWAAWPKIEPEPTVADAAPERAVNLSASAPAESAAPGQPEPMVALPAPELAAPAPVEPATSIPQAAASPSPDAQASPNAVSPKRVLGTATPDAQKEAAPQIAIETELTAKKTVPPAKEMASAPATERGEPVPASDARVVASEAQSQATDAESPAEVAAPQADEAPLQTYTGQAVAATSDAGPNPKIIEFLEASHITGVKVAGSRSRVLLNNQVFRIGSIVEATHRLRITDIQPQIIEFTDESGARYRKQFEQL